MSTIGVLLTNLGTPDKPTTAAVRTYLAEFLSDPRVVELPRIIWWPILHGIILRLRPQRSAKLYQKIWTEKGSPLRVILEEQAHALQKTLGEDIKVIAAMRYGNPSIKSALDEFKKLGIKKILLFPLYPQYCAATTATTFDAVASELKKWRWQPALRTITTYHDDKNYINAVAASIENYWQQHGRTQKLLFSFHGLPKAFLLKGDPYHCFCHKTARLVAEKLQLARTEWDVTFQSRLGKAEWLKPYTDQMLKNYPKENIKTVTVVCPGFSADCLETLEEINMQNRELFLEAGGEAFHYVPALNASDAHIQLLANLIKQHTEGWGHGY